ncbi:glycosyltransferase [Mucilaginibacter sp.]|uniref:glycosyltransferase n=1 Tax=Mucilaginibacter sp. TaxID=1882438 RepID=UPI003AFF6F60
MLKVVHINTYDGNGGAGRACLRLNLALNEIGDVDSKVVVFYKFGQNPAVKTFTNTWFKRGRAAAAIITERLLAKRYLKPVKIPFSFTWFGISIIKNPKVLAADVIHLHWVNHSFLNPKHLAELAELNKPIVWTFHDSNAFTGGCHVRYTCDHFERSCGDCPVLADAQPNDISHQIWKQKNEAYQQLNFRIIAPSSWMKASVLRSSLMVGKQIDIIPNTLETNIFQPQNQQEARKKLDLPKDKFIFLTGFMPSKKDSHKGAAYLLESLELLVAKNSIDPSQIELVVFGNRNTEDMPVFPFKTTFLGTIKDDEKLAACYAAADAFLIPSLEDNLPYTVMESLACGTPVIAFTTGGIPDMVQHLHNGFLADYKSSESFCEGLEWIKNYPVKEALRQNAHETVMQKFSEKVIAQKHSELYKSLISHG